MWYFSLYPSILAPCAVFLPSSHRQTDHWHCPRLVLLKNHYQKMESSFLENSGHLKNLLIAHIRHFPQTELTKPGNESSGSSAGLRALPASSVSHRPPCWHTLSILFFTVDIELRTSLFIRCRSAVILFWSVQRFGTFNTPRE